MSRTATLLFPANRTAIRGVTGCYDTLTSRPWSTHRDHRKPINRLQALCASRVWRRGKVAAFALIALATALPATAAPLQSHESIRQAAHQYLDENPPLAEGRFEINIGYLDTRLRLQQCAAALEVFPAPGSRTTGHTTLGVRCPGPKPWKLYLPVAIKVYQPVVTATHAMARGALLTENDIQLEEKEISRLGYGYVSDPAQAVGKALRRSVTPGTVLTPNAMTAPRVVERGQTVVIVATGGGIEVRMAGEALSDGALNDRIRVRNTKTRRIVEGVVSSPGVVQVPL